MPNSGRGALDFASASVDRRRPDVIPTATRGRLGLRIGLNADRAGVRNFIAAAARVNAMAVVLGGGVCLESSARSATRGHAEIDADARDWAFDFP